MKEYKLSMLESGLQHIIEKLKSNNFDVFFAENIEMARSVFENQILTNIRVSSVSYADSITIQKLKVLEQLKANDSIEFIDTFDPNDSWRDQINKRKRALTVDLFLTGTNAITETGCLVNLDMIGNRVAPIAFGPRNVVVFVGKNKIVKSIDEAFVRIKTISAPQNAKRHPELKLPCQKTGECRDCKSEYRICNTWTITEKSYPKNRIKIVLINQDLGL